MKKNAVLGLASGYTYEQLAPFIKTLKASGFNGDIIFFVSDVDPDTERALVSKGVKLVHFQKHFPFFSQESKLNVLFSESLRDEFYPATLRYILYYLYLKEYGSLYENIMISDVRDVIFQADPFNYEYKPGISCFLEDPSVSIAQEKYNSTWIKGGYGEGVLKQIGHHTISCSGVTLGQSASMMDYLGLMIDQIFRINPICKFGGMDQGIHNFLIYTHQLPFANLIADDEGPVTTLSIFKEFDKIKFNSSGQITNKKNQVINIVHQYDRHLQLLWRYNKKGFFVKSLNLLKQRLYFLKTMLRRS